jgi:hypothetical protein
MNNIENLNRRFKYIKKEYKQLLQERKNDITKRKFEKNYREIQ